MIAHCYECHQLITDIEPFDDLSMTARIFCDECCDDEESEDDL